MTRNPRERQTITSPPPPDESNSSDAGSRPFPNSQQMQHRRTYKPNARRRTGAAAVSAGKEAARGPRRRIVRTADDLQSSRIDRLPLLAAALRLRTQSAVRACDGRGDRLHSLQSRKARFGEVGRQAPTAERPAVLKRRTSVGPRSPSHPRPACRVLHISPSTVASKEERSPQPTHKQRSHNPGKTADGSGRSRCR